MRILSLDISTKTGWAFFDNCVLSKYGRIDIVDKKFNKIDYKVFSQQTLVGMFFALGNFYRSISKLFKEINPDVIVVEQTNLGRQRISQKMLEWLHLIACLVSLTLFHKFPVFLDSSDWRKIVGLRLTKADKDHNKAIKKQGKRGKIGKKQLAIRIVNEKYKDRLQQLLKMKDNDIADAILVADAWIAKNNING